MAVRHIDKEHQARDEDWEGNNAAFSCPVCGKVFLVSAYMHGDGHKGARPCPGCKKSTGNVGESKKDPEGFARIEWPNLTKLTP